jgi:hypothetical protein
MYNNGMVIVLPGAAVQVTGSLGGSPAITGGAWIALPGATIDLGFPVEGIGGGGLVRGGTTSFPDLFGLPAVNEGGRLDLTESSTFGAPMVVEPGGAVGVGDGFTVTIPELKTRKAPGIIGEVGRSSLVLPDGPGGGAATIVTSIFTNEGLTSLGEEGDHGELHVIGNFTQDTTGVLEASLGGTMAGVDHDRLVVDGNVALDGTLRMSFDADYEPVGGEQYTILSVINGTIVGTFAAVDAPGSWSLDHQPNQMIATLIAPPVEGDVNGDGVVDVLDLLLVLAAWGNTSGPEDINGDGVVDVLDLLALLAAWG